ncbi:MAG: rhodanese-like domain-containing protein [Candidatus Lernaella stagnicola]|nr:rhodanese-like domain-containing protein [Candidatus Lernaella stagnicola]
MNRFLKTTLLLAVFVGFAMASIVHAEEAAKVYTADELAAEAKALTNCMEVAATKAAVDAGKFAVILDVREAKEFKAGHIPGAINIPRGVLEFKIADKIADTATPILVYCKKGGRGCLCCVQLMKMGYSAVTNLDGGWEAWEKAEYPVE